MRTLATILTCLLAVPAGANELAARLTDLLTRYERCGLRGAVLVSAAGKPVVMRGVGLADPGTTRRNTARTLFEVASFTKQFTAAAVLRLAQQGKLKLDDPIARHLPAVPESCKAVTIHHLLTHTSGIPGRNTAGRGEDLAAAVVAFIGDGPRHAPGSRWEYWNGGYALLAGVIERASGQSYARYCREQLFAPAGMTDSGFTGDRHLPAERAALGRSRYGPPRRALDHPYGSYGYQYRGMGGAVTTLVDLLKWDRALDGDTVLNAASRATLFRPLADDYACGWMVDTLHGEWRQRHGGSVRGFVCDVRRYPARDAMIAVLSCEDGLPVGVVASSLEALLFGKAPKHAPPPAFTTPPPGGLARFAGAYRDKNGDRLVVTVDGDTLQVGLEGQQTIGALSSLWWPGWPADFTELSARAVAIVTGISKGDVSLLRRHMAPAIPTSWPAAVKTTLWPRQLANHGALKSVRSLGAKTVRDRCVVVLALEHERAPSRVQIEFGQRGLQILRWDGPTFPVVVTLRPTGPTTFADYDWRQVRRYAFAADGERVVRVNAGERTYLREK